MLTCPTKFIGVTAAARALGIDAKWLRHEIHAGRLPAIRMARGVVCDPVQLGEALKRRAAAGLNEAENANDTD